MAETIKPCAIHAAAPQTDPGCLCCVIADLCRTMARTSALMREATAYLTSDYSAHEVSEGEGE